MYYGYYEKAIYTLQNHLKLEKAKWKDERCASMRFIARCYLRQGNYEEAKKWATKAIEEAPYLRDPYMEKAMISYQEKDWQSVITLCLQALPIDENKKSYINESFCRDFSIYDTLSIAFYYVGLYEFSYFSIQKALKISPQDSRLLKNLKFIEEKRK